MAAKQRHAHVTGSVDNTGAARTPDRYPRANLEPHLDRLWRANPELHAILLHGRELESVRDGTYDYLAEAERAMFAIDCRLHALDRATACECIRALRSIFGPINEHRTGVSALAYLWRFAQGLPDPPGPPVSVGFIEEFVHLFLGVAGRPGVYVEPDGTRKVAPGFLGSSGREAAIARSEHLDGMAERIGGYLRRYPCGLDDEVVERRAEHRRRVLAYFRGSAEDWDDWHWQMKHVIRRPEVLFDLVELTDAQRASVGKAVRNHLPFGVTPYYVSLMDLTPGGGADHAVRAQVIPPAEYVDEVVARQFSGPLVMDFMGETDTSPVDLITRRYPMVAILKPFRACAQVCVYCQRNWELRACHARDAMAPEDRLDTALAWLEQHPAVGDVLITGGDPAIMPDATIGRILSRVASMAHVYRIRLGTRTPVVLPSRWTEGLADLLARYQEPGRREVAVVTHFEHAYEVTPEAAAAVQRIVRRGMRVYNQEVFTIENSRRFESAKLRLAVRSIGVDPYYTFSMKGKAETRRYMVPIARILQERKEEARLLPGLDRTDEPVFNVPKLGKNHLRAWQDHRLVMIRPDGARVYELHPWEKNLALVPPFNYIDVPIWDYLEELAARGENVEEYRTVWYYL